MAKTSELCPNCEHEVKLKAKFFVQICPKCKRFLMPCSLCYMDFTNCTICPLDNVGDEKILTSFLSGEISKKQAHKTLKILSKEKFVGENFKKWYVNIV